MFSDFLRGLRVLRGRKVGMDRIIEKIDIIPPLKDFLRLSQGPAAVPLCLKIPVGDLDPPSVFERVREGRDSFLLESVKGISRIGRYSIIGTRPFRIFQSRDQEIQITEGIYETKIQGNPFQELRRFAFVAHDAITPQYCLGKFHRIINSINSQCQDAFILQVSGV